MSMGEINSLCQSGMGSTSNSVNTSPVSKPKSSNTSAEAMKSAVGNTDWKKDVKVGHNSSSQGGI